MSVILAVVICALQTSSLWIPFDDVGGDKVIEVTYRDVVFSGFVSHSRGKCNEALVLHEGQFINLVGVSLPMRLEDFSISIWAMMRDIGTGGRTIFAIGEDSIRSLSITVEQNLEVTCSWNGQRRLTTGSVNLDTWHHFVVSINLSEIIIYLDAGVIHREPYSQSKLTSKIAIGCNVNGDAYYGWFVADELRIWNKTALDSGEVSRLFGAPCNNFPTTTLLETSTLIPIESHTTEVKDSLEISVTETLAPFLSVLHEEDANLLSNKMEIITTVAALIDSTIYGSAAPAGRLFLVSSTRCRAATSLHDATLPFFLHPTGMSALKSSFVGAIIGNFVLAATVAAAGHFVLVFVSSNRIKQFLPVEATGLVSIVHVVFHILYQGTAFCSLVVAINPPLGGERDVGRLIGITGVGVCIFLPWWAHVTLKAIPSHAVFVPFFKMNGVIVFIVGPGKWSKVDGTDWFETHHTMFKRFKQKDAMVFSVVEFAAMFILACLSALQYEDYNKCLLVRITSAFFCLVCSILYVIKTPYFRTRDVFHEVVHYVMLAASLTCSGVALYKEPATPAELHSTLRDAAAIALAAAAVLLVIKTILDLLALILVIFTNASLHDGRLDAGQLLQGSDKKLQVDNVSLVSENNRTSSSFELKLSTKNGDDFNTVGQGASDDTISVGSHQYERRMSRRFSSPPHDQFHVTNLLGKDTGSNISPFSGPRVSSGHVPIPVRYSRQRDVPHRAAMRAKLKERRKSEGDAVQI